MIDERAQHRRRADFDELARGWGADTREDLEARISLVAELVARDGPLTFAEEKIVAAMAKRLRAILADA